MKPTYKLTNNPQNNSELNISLEDKTILEYFHLYLMDQINIDNHTGKTYIIYSDIMGLTQYAQAPVLDDYIVQYLPANSQKYIKDIQNYDIEHLAIRILKQDYIIENSSKYESYLLFETKDKITSEIVILYAVSDSRIPKILDAQNKTKLLFK